MSDVLTVFLFDVDGVIVEPLGYRAGITQTLKVLTSKIGLHNPDTILPTAADVSYMEACGLHDVWDITNIAFALILLEVVENVGDDCLEVAEQATLEERLLAITKANPSIRKPDYAKYAVALKTYHGKVHPPDVIYDLLVTTKVPSNATRKTAWGKLLSTFLKGTRSPFESAGTKLFQNIILGSDEFIRNYNLESEYSGPSLLKHEDKVAIDRITVETIFRLKEQHNFRAAVYTARPSLPPRDKAPLSGYSPEAELALEASGISNLPLVGMGMMDWLAQKYDVNPQSLTKPHRTQALAAILAAVRGNSNSETLGLAYDFVHGKLDELEDLKTKNLDIYVFEDTISGINPIQTLRDILTEKGYHIKVNALGIATDDNKIASLEKVCTKVFPNVNDAFDFAVTSAGLKNSLAQK